MSAIKGTGKNGQVILDEPATLPDGARVGVMPAETGRDGPGVDEGPVTPEEIEAVLAAMEQLEPGWLSPEDDAAWRAALQQQKDFEKARFVEDAEKLRRMWE